MSCCLPTKAARTLFSRPWVLLAAVLFAGIAVFEGLEHRTRAEERGWTPLPIEQDPLLRMPGTQPSDGVLLDSPETCMACHANYDPAVEPGFNWRGTMMANSARDPLFWACMTVAAQDSIFWLGNPNATDMCMRCHMPAGWLGGRSTELNGSDLVGNDFDGVSCDFCHRMYDPFHEETFNGDRPEEGSDWANLFDEAPGFGLFGPNPSLAAAAVTYAADKNEASMLTAFNGHAFYGPDGLPYSPNYRENSSGQYFVAQTDDKRAGFADAEPLHAALYSRYHKSKYFCSTCHDVSNPILANFAFQGTKPEDGLTQLPSEKNSANSYAHVERTFSEFMLSDYGLEGGAPGVGPYDPSVFATSMPNNNIGSCQDCHMPDGVGKGCRFDVPVRPDDSTAHPRSGQPVHDLTGGNMWVPWLLASTVPGSPNYDAFNETILDAGPAVLTLDLDAGLGLDPDALLAATDRAEITLQRAASIQNVAYDDVTGDLSFRVVNQTGHKLITGYGEGRRMFVNIQAFSGGSLVWEVNPYDTTGGTLRGLSTDYSPSSPPVGVDEEHIDELVYESHFNSSITGEDITLHFILSTGQEKDNRIPPKGFRIAEAPERLSEPVVHGVIDPNLYTAAEYLGGHDDVDMTIPAGADRIEIRLYYQTISREYAQFLSNEINGTGDLTLPMGAYIAQSDPFFDQLKEWGDAIWDLWDHNKNVPGAAPVLMTEAAYDVP